MSTIPIIQILEIRDHTKQHLVALPSEELPPLPPSHVRFKTRLFALSANNLTYARIGHLAGWWGIHPLPQSTPAPFRNASVYGRIMCWGTGQVVESNLPLLKVGDTLFGTFPIGTLAVDKEMELDAPGVFLETTAHRRNVLPVYNRYFLYNSDDAISEEDRAWDAVMRGHFETSYALHRITFSWDPIELPPINPSDTAAPWSTLNASMTDAIVLIFAASGKTAAPFAQQIKRFRPAQFRPRRLVAIGSSAARAFTEGFGSWSVDRETKVIILDYGARGDAAASWANSLRPFCKEIQFIRVANDANIRGVEANTRAMLSPKQPGETNVNSSVLRDWGMEKLGVDKYFQELGMQWGEYRRSGGLPGLKLKWSDGMESVRDGWQQLSDAKVDPSTALVFSV